MASDYEREYEIKAAFLYHFSKLFYAQDLEGEEDGTPLIVGIVDSPAMLGFLKRVEGKRAHGRPIVIEVFDSRQSDMGSLSQCDLIFIDRSAQSKLSALLKDARFARALCVSDIEDFIDKGGCIGFVESRGRLAFEVNLQEAEKRGLKINAKLLELASRIKR